MESKKNTFFLHPEIDGRQLNNIEKKNFLLSGRFDIHRFRDSLRYLIKQDLSLLHHQIDVVFRDISNLGEDQQVHFLTKYEQFNHIDIMDQKWWMQFAFFQLSEQKFKLIWTANHAQRAKWKSYLFIDMIFDVYWKDLEFATINHSLDLIDEQEIQDYWYDYTKNIEPIELTKLSFGSFDKKQFNKQHKCFVNEISQSNQLLNEENISSQALYQAVWAILLWRYYDQDRVSFAVTKRSGQMFPLCLQMDAEMTYFNLIHQVQDILDQCKLYPFMDRTHFFDHLLQVSDPIEHNYHDVHMTCLDEIDQYHLYIQVNKAQIDVVYSEQHFSAMQIEQMIGHLQNILRQINHNPHTLIQEIEILAEDEKEQLLFHFNDTKHPLPSHTVDQLIEQRAIKQPNALAVVSEEHTLTYQELIEKSNRLANILQNKGIDKGDIVGLMTDNSVWMFVGALGIMKAGAAYLPIDKHYPQNRVQYILADSATKFLLIESGVEVPQQFAGEVLVLDALPLDRANISSLMHRHQKNDPAYMIYTSGSTGKPKGVVVPHLALLNLVTWHNTYYQVTAEDRSTKYAGYGFDASVWEVFPYLVAGATVYIVPDQIRYDLDELHQYFEQNQITCSFLPTQMAELFSKRDHNTLRVLLTGGDRLRKVTAQSYQIANNYGPTENTVVTTSGLIDPSSKMISIGKPIFNNQVYILSRFNHLQPIGIPGELCISGDSLANGYLHRTKLTNEKFIPNPFAESQKLYRTGDLARWLPDGSIEYLGRIDNQVKIRGYRIELGEIESQLLQCEGVESAIVIAQPDSQQELSLCAYFVVKSAERITDLRTELAKQLPEYMLPDHLIQIDEVPLTANGKIDLDALPKPKLIRNYQEDSCTASNEIEQKLMQLWSEVLGVDVTNLKDHFFQMGGHSLKATMLISRIRRQWGIRISLTDFFKYPTVSAMAHLINQLKSETKFEQKTMVTALTKQDQTYYPVSSVQKRLYALQQNKDIGTAYHTPIVWEIKGYLDVRRLQSTIQAIVDRHEVFRTSLCFYEGELMQQIHPSVEWGIEHLQAKDVLEAKEQVGAFIHPFQLEHAPLFRIGLVRIKADHHVLVWDMHHILCDGITTGILHREFMQIYQGENLPALSFQYKDYAVWQRNQLETGQMKEDQTYWREQFSKVPVAALPTDYPRPMKQQFSGEKIIYSFHTTLTQACKEFSLQHDTTLYMLLFSVYALMLAKYTGHESVVVGSVVAGRSKQEWESVCGMFVNTLPIKVTVQKDLSYVTFLQEVKKKILAGQDHGEYPFAEIIADLDEKWEAGRNPLFDTVFVAQNTDIPMVRIPNLSIYDFSYEEKHSLFDMTWEVMEQETLQLRIEYNTSLYQCETIQQMIDHFVHLLKQVLAKPEQKLSVFTLMTEEEHEKVMNEFNNTQYPLPFDQTVLHWFANQVNETPDQKAIVADKQSLTYKQLHEQSNQLAHLLRKKGVSNGAIVSILVEPSFDLFISILAVLKVGAAYLPIDPAYPKERIRYMLHDSQSSTLLAPRLLWTDHFEGNWIDLTKKEWLVESKQDITLVQMTHDLAYVIYTSGSTGKPKGVTVSHKALLNLVTWHNQYYQVTKEDRSTKYAGLGFDASVWEIFPYLLAGATIYVVDSTIRQDVDALNQFFEANQITISFLPTALAEEFIKLENHSLRALLVGGDKLRQIRSQTYDIFNNYGPTENTVVTTCYQIQDRADNKLPIGRPIFNNQVYIVDQALRLQPIGIPGELCISGDSLASGYLHRTKLTNEKFVSNPFKKGQKMYRTGDLARWLPDGNLEYLGRMDQQVQVRGYRVELGEIESHLLAHQAVKNGVVSVYQDENGQNVLCAYLMMDEKVQTQVLRDDLAKLLPEYMIPTHFIELENMPLTPNGKVDHEALPKPVGTIGKQTTYVAPTNELQRRLVKIWEEVLHVSNIGINDHFFSLGGDSIKAIQIAAQLQKHGQKVAVNDLIEHPTIAELTQYVKFIKESDESEEITGVVPLTPIQHWFFEQKFPTKHHWNQAMMIPSDDQWDVTVIERVFQELVKRHDALRMQFVEGNGKIQQVNRGFAGQHFTVELISCIHEADPQAKMEREANRLQQSLDLKDGPLVRLAVFQTKEKHYLLIVIHHLVIDGVSWRILLDDFMHAYQSCLKSEKISFQKKSNSFQLWSRKLQAYANSEELLRELSYWQEIDTQRIPSICQMECQELSLLRDGIAIEFALSKSQTASLLHDVHHAYRTEINDVLLAALGFAIREWTQVQRIAIQLEGHGRESILDDVDITQTVGWFTSIYPVVLDIQTTDLASTIKSVKETLHQVPMKGIGYGILRYLTHPENKKGISWRLKPEISFNYLGQFDQQVLFAGMGTATKHLGNCFSSETFMLPIEIYGMVVDGQLQVRFLFNRLRFKKETMQRLVDLYQHFLLKIIDHCMEQTESTWTPSDFSASDVSVEELDQFLESLE